MYEFEAEWEKVDVFSVACILTFDVLKLGGNNSVYVLWGIEFCSLLTFGGLYSCGAGFNCSEGLLKMVREAYSETLLLSASINLLLFNSFRICSILFPIFICLERLFFLLIDFSLSDDVVTYFLGRTIGREGWPKL